MLNRFVLAFLLLIFFPFSALSAEISAFHVVYESNQVKFIFNSDKPITYSQFFLSKPERLIVDMKKTHTKINFSSFQKELASSPVKDIRYHAHAQGYLRVVFDLKHKATVKLFRLSSPNQFVVAFPSLHASMKPVVTLPIHQPLRKIVVVIDPGHGGKDPGATGPGGHHEKTVVLAIAKDLQQFINKEPGFTAKLTRNGDYFIPLWGRLKIARKDHADMFIAIHADAYKNSTATGATVFALSERGATSAAARWLAEKENQSELMGGVDLGNKDATLRSVLISLSQNHTIAESLQIGSAILRQLSRLTLLHEPRVEQAAFVVLKSPDIPSLLVETGFITNPRDERRLINPRYQHKLAYALSLGVKDYFMHHPPPDTYLSAMVVNHRTYNVRKGDTLTSIAMRYGLSVQTLQKTNDLAKNEIYVGQVLTIPTS